LLRTTRHHLPFDYFQHKGEGGYGNLSYQDWIRMCNNLLDDNLTDVHLKTAFMQSTMCVRCLRWRMCLCVHVCVCVSVCQCLSVCVLALLPHRRTRDHDDHGDQPSASR
jgi:hypothetical protein